MFSIKQMALACDKAGAYAIVWHYGRQRDYRNLGEATIQRISRAVDKLVAAGDFWIFPVGTGEIGWVAGRND